MRIIGPWRASVILACVLASISAPEASAQSLFQSLFGNIFQSSPPKTAPSPAPSVEVSPLRQGTNFAVQEFGSRGPETRQPSLGGAYRTVCVRTCDGYYFPISGSTSRHRFGKDAESCSARCGGSKLYYLPRRSEDMAAMVDLTGRRYDQLANAFVYRKKLISGCVCRPMPWTAAERARHNRYAYAEAILRLNEERAQKLRDQAIARAKNPASEAGQDSAEADQESRSNNDAIAVAIEGIGSQGLVARTAGPAGETEIDETTGSAYLATVKAAISGEDTDGALAGAEDDAAAQTVSFSPRRAQAAQRSTSVSPRRQRKTKHESSPTTGWSFSGGSKYTWPGDR